jgi:hypothetical protein
MPFLVCYLIVGCVACQASENQCVAQVLMLRVLQGQPMYYYLITKQLPFCAGGLTIVEIGHVGGLDGASLTIRDIRKI